MIVRPHVGAAAIALIAAIFTLVPSPTRSQTEPQAPVVPIDTVTRRIDGALSGGRIFERLVSRADSGQHYALYLPSRYSSDVRWPVLFVLDPRGRALVPMRRFLAAAERHGYVVISSYNTLSDGPTEPNQAAMNAMLDDVQRALSVDSRRFYLVGFSGTARFAWEWSTQLVGSIAGIVGAGAAVPGGRAWIRAHVGSTSPVFFGAIGTLDPNYEELRALDAELDSTRTSHRVERFDGPHEWPPAAVCDRAVAWLELQAMHRGIKRRDQRWIDSLHAHWVGEARRLDQSGSLVAAHRLYGQVAVDFAGLVDAAAASAVTARHAALANDPSVRRTALLEHEVAQRDRRLGEALVAFLRDLRRAEAPPALGDARRRIELDVLRREAARTDDSVSAVAARRALARIFAHASFYAPRALLAERRWAHAALALQLARAIAPTDGGVCLSLARALAQTGDHTRSLEALECAAASGQLTAAALEGDALLEPVRGEARYRSIVRQLGGRS